MILSVQIQIFFKAFFGSGVKDPALDWSIIRRPVNKDHFTDGHMIFVGELKIEDTISILFFRERVNEIIPSLLFGPNPFNILRLVVKLQFFR